MISFIIPNRGGTQLANVIENIKNVYHDIEKEIVVIQQNDNDFFKKGQLYNIAIKHCLGDYIVLTDNDIIHFNKIDFFNVYSNNNNLPFLGFDEITQISLIKNNYTVLKSEKRPYGYGACLFLSKKQFLSVNGFSNLYMCWGREDNEFALRLIGDNTSCMTPNIFRIKQKLGHISHKRRCDANLHNTKLNIDVFNKRYNRNIMLDGYVQTTYNLIKEERCNDVVFLYVDNINVTSNYVYYDTYKKHYI